MLFVYVDDFGHVGPYVSRADPQHNTSPVYGFAGFAMPEAELRGFSTFFLQLKEHNLAADAAKAQKPIYKWEKKGTNLFTRNSISRYRAVREMGFRLLNEVHQRNGFVFYYGREKLRGPEARNPVGLQRTVLGKAIRRLDRGAQRRRSHFALVMDQCSARLELLEYAQKTMHGDQPCRQLVSPPFEVESHLNQAMQAADWIATLVGRVWAWKLDPEGFAEYADYDKYFSDRLQRTAQFSTVERRDDITRTYSVKGRSSAQTVLLQRRVTETIVQTETVIQQSIAVSLPDMTPRKHRKSRNA